MRKRIAIALALAVAVAVIAIGGFAIASQQEGNGGTQKAPDAAIPAEAGQDASSAGEEWPGQSKGYIGPNGEGAYSEKDWDSDDEYAAIMQEVYREEYEAPVIVRDDSYVEGILLITFGRDCGELKARQIIEESGGIWVSSDFGYYNTARGEYSEDVATAKAYYPDCLGEDALFEKARELEENPEVRWAELNGILHSSEDDSDSPTADEALDEPLRTLQQYYLYSSRFTYAWEEATCDGSVCVAVIDSGFYLSHPDLQANLVLGYDATTQSLLTSNYLDDDGHGTKVAGVISAITGNSIGIDGASFNAKVLPIRIMDDYGVMSWDYLNRALQRVIDLEPNVQVVNMSLESLSQSTTCENLLSELYEDGIVCVAASGNWRSGEASPNLVKYPAAYNGVISVGSIDISDLIASDSNRNAFVDMCAPGVSVYTTANPLSAGTLGLYYCTDSGTSFAAPQVAAAAALLKAQDPDRNAQDIENQIETTARDLGATGRDDYYGYGALDAAAAVGWTPPSSPFTGPSDDAQISGLQVAYQKWLQSTGPDAIPAALERAMQANPDVFGWLYVPGTDLSLPLAMDGPGGSYYLDHGSGGEQNGFGCAFGRGGSRDLSDAVTVLYGHSFADVGLAFTSLHSFEGYSFFAGHDEAYVYLPGRRLEYRIVAANLFNSRAIEDVDQSDAADLADYFAELSNTDPAAFMGLKRAFSLDPASDRILQLSTCTVPADPAHRYVMTCVYVGEEELQG